MSSRIGIAIIGLGNALEPHAKSLIDLRDRVRVCWAAARSDRQTAAVAARWGFPVTTDIARVLADPCVDAVLLLTPANAHLDLAEACFAAGRHVLCEKPVEASVVRGEQLVAAGRRAERRLGVVLQFRFRPAMRRLRMVLDAGALGRVQAATVSVPWWRPQSYYDEPGRGSLARDGGGVLTTQAIHMLDAFRWLLGPMRVTAAQVTTTAMHRMETEDFATAQLRLEDGAPATVMATTAAYPGGAEEIVVIGSLGTARMVGGGLRLSWIDGREDVMDDEGGGTGSGANVMGFSHEPHKAVLTDFLDAITQNRDPAITGEDALETQRLIAAIIAKGAG